jgi:hypothetical protein
MAQIAIGEVVEDLRSELESAVAAAAGAGERFRFDVGPIELTLSVEVSREATPGAKVRFWVVEAGADVTLSNASTQELKLTLTPVDTADPAARPPSPGSVRITGASVAGER